MKKIIIAAYIFLCICLTGCGGTNQKDYGENYNQQQDAQNFSMIRNAAATENGFYVLQDQYVYFIDKKSKNVCVFFSLSFCIQFRYVENQIANTKIIHVMPILLIRRIFRHMPEIFM